jgi:hypothetical protein
MVGAEQAPPDHTHEHAPHVAGSPGPEKSPTGCDPSGQDGGVSGAPV